VDPGGGSTATSLWLLVITFGIASVGIAGLNLHLFSYVTDIGYSPLIAASFMSTIALTQLGSTLGGECSPIALMSEKSLACSFNQGVGLVVIDKRANPSFTPAFLYGTSPPAASFCASDLGQLRPRFIGDARPVVVLFSFVRASGAPFFGFSTTARAAMIIFHAFSFALFTSSALILLQSYRTNVPWSTNIRQRSI
jgi:hypothetical protein